MRTLKRILWGEAAAVMVSVIFGTEGFMLGDRPLSIALVIFALCNVVAILIFCVLKAVGDS